MRHHRSIDRRAAGAGGVNVAAPGRRPGRAGRGRCHGSTSREAPMIEPDGMRDALPIDGQCRPAAITRGPIGLQGHRRLEGQAAISRSRALDRRRRRRARSTARSPDGSPPGVPGTQRDPGRQFPAEPPFTGLLVDAHRRAERAAAVATDRREDVGLAVGPGTPRHRDERPCAATDGVASDRPGTSSATVAACSGAEPGNTADSAATNRAVVQIRKRVDMTALRSAGAARTAQLRGSPTAVTWLKDGDGWVGYAPVPKLVLRAVSLTVLVRLNTSASASSPDRARHGERRG